MTLLVVAPPLYGGSITLTTSSTSIVFEDGVKIEVTTINSGDETAERVGISMFFQGEVSKSPVKHRLVPGESFTVRFPIIIPPRASGAYTVLVLVDFHDVKGYPFSALSYTTFAVGPVALPEVFAKPVDVTIVNHGAVKLEIENTAQRRLSVKVRLAAPRELRQDPKVISIDIPPGEVEPVVFPIDKWTAREGAVYTVLTLIEYQDDNRHFSSVSENRVRVAEKRDFFKAHWIILLLINLCLVAGVVWSELVSRRKVSGGHNWRFSG